MKLKLLLAVAMLALCAQSPVQALPVHYEGNILSYTTVNGSVGGFGWIDDDAANVDFWTFTANAGSRVTIRGTRLDSPLDPAFSLYRGSTTADASLFLHDADWGGLVFLTLADDEVPVTSGPFNDPLLSAFLIPTTGTYTIAIGGFASDGNGPYRYSLSVAVPTPGSLMLLAAGILSLGWALRRSR